MTTQTLPPIVPALRDAFTTSGVARRLERNQQLFGAGDPVLGLHFVVSGHLRIVRGNPRSVVVHHEGPGGMLGETALFGDSPYPATALATEPTECRWLRRESVHALVARHPAVAEFFLTRLARRLLGVIERLDAMSLGAVAPRLARWILDRPGADRGATVSLGGTQSEVAEELGTVREVLVRELRQMVDAGWIARAGRGLYRISEPGALATIATPKSPQ